MRLIKWLEGMEYEVIQGDVNVAVTDVIYDSRKVTDGVIFICIKGMNINSHDFIDECAEKGAKVFVIDQDVDHLPKQTTVIKVKNTRQAMALLSAARFNYPLKKMVSIGVTGTKGKTTTTYMIKAMLESAGKKVGLIGTAGAMIGEKIFPTINTTPESYQLHEYFAQMVEEGCEYLLMEVSSQGIMMHRTDGIMFDYGIFTNISNDHIGPGEHQDFAEYLHYKSQLLNMCRIGLINCDDPHFNAVSSNASCQLYRYSLIEPSDFKAEQLSYLWNQDFVGVGFEVQGKIAMNVQVGIPGKFNVYNALAAISLGSFLGLSKDEIAVGLKEIKVNGRMEIVHTSKQCTIIVDYAHNAISMESLLTTLREYSPKRLVCVFGCGGNRSKDRRYAMGEIGGRLADFCIITADNSRYEKVEDIMADIRSSMEKTDGEFIEIADRKNAIDYSVRYARPGDLIAVIGKGHEDYQEIEGVRHHFLDREVIEAAVNTYLSE